MESVEYFKKLLTFDRPSLKKKNKDEDNLQEQDLRKPSKAKVQKKKATNSSVDEPAAATLVQTTEKPAALATPISREELKARLQAKIEGFQAKRHADMEQNRAKQLATGDQKKVRVQAKKAEKKKGAGEISNAVVPEPAKAVSTSGMVFNKFDFDTQHEVIIGNRRFDPEDGKAKNRPKAILPKDPRQALQKIQAKSERLAELEKTDAEKAEAWKKADAWTKAIQKSQGLAIKDDVKLLKKAIQRKETAKKKRTDNWEERQTKLKEDQEARQRKRTENIEARKEAKKAGKKGNKGKPSKVQKKRPGFEGGHFRRKANK